MGSQARRMLRRFNDRRFMHYQSDIRLNARFEDSWTGWAEVEDTTVCRLQVRTGIQVVEDQDDVTCPRCTKWLADQVAQALGDAVVEDPDGFVGYNRTL